MQTLFTILLALLAQAALGEEYYYIVPVYSTFVCQHYPGGTCFTLDTFSYHLSNTEKRNITLTFHPGEHLLTQDMRFNDLYSITLINAQRFGVSPKISCVENTGLTISNSNRVIINGLTIYKCWNGGPILSFYDIGNLHIQDCTFSGNINKSPSIVCEQSYYSGTTLIVRATAIIRNCTYKSNSVSNPISYGYICNSARPGGGAMYVENSTIEIDTCSFEENYAAHAMYYVRGGALAITESIGNIYNSTFINNYVDSTNEGRGGAIYLNMLPDTERYIYISHCHFYNNMAYYGGAIAADSAATNHANINLDTTVTEQTKYACKFSSNEFIGNRASRYGGAVYSFVSTIFQSETFVRNRAGEDGGAIMFTGPLVTVNLSNCVFTDHQQNLSLSQDNPDNALITGHVTVIILTNITVANNTQSLYADSCHIKFYGHSSFTNNRLGGQKGGALMAIGSTVTFYNSSITEISDNEAVSGGGLYLEDSTLTVYGDLLIRNNIANYSGGGIYAYQSVMEFILFEVQAGNSYIHVSNNSAIGDGGGIYLASSRLDNMKHTITINDNHASRFGGGLYLSSNSKINMKAKYAYSNLIFLHLKTNSALKGGGIYVSDKSSSQDICSERFYVNDRTSDQAKCFIQQYYDLVFTAGSSAERKPVILTYFENNTALEAGSEIYGGLLDRCLIDTIFTGNMFMKQNVGWGWGGQMISVTVDGQPSEVHTVDKTSEFFNHISSDPVKLCFCVNNIVDCTFTPPTVHKKKGETFNLSLAAVDQVGKPLNATLFSSVNLDGRKGGIKVGQQFRTLPDHCVKLDYNVYYDQSEAVLELYPDGPCGNQGMSKREIKIAFNACMCPQGFEQLNSSINCSCDCTDELKPYINQCWPDEGTFQLKDNNWIQYINNTDFIIHECLFDFCTKESLNISLSEPSDIQCAFDRTGLLCGKCAQGLSMVFANSQCRPCSNYYLFLLLPFGLAGIALVAFILLLNITVATGTIHGLIFYANIITANRSIFLPFGIPNVLTVFVSWLNLDLGIETCFYDGMDSYGKLMLQLVFPAYVFFLIFTIMVLCDRSQRIAQFFGKRNPEATLYTLFLLSYSKLIRTIITALQFATLDYPDGSQEIVWLYDANVRYFALNHIPRFLAAFIITILGAVYTSLLLFGQLFNRCSEYRLMKWTSHKYYIHFLKAHHAPLSDKHRYWVGLLLLARLIHYLVSAFADKFWVVLSVLVMTLSFLMHKTIFKSYTKKHLNLLEVLFMTNLLVLAGATFFVQVSGGDQQALAIVSMSISFIAFLGIIFYHILDSYGLKLKNAFTNILLTPRQRRNIDDYPVAFELNNEIAEDDHESDEELIDLSNALEDTATNESYDPSRYITPPIIRSAFPDDQLREPLMDSPLTSADYNLQPARPRIRQIRQAPTVTEVVITK